MNLKFIGLSAIRRLPQITLVDRVTNSRASLSRREHSPYEIGRTKRSTCDPQHFSGPSVRLRELYSGRERAHRERSNDRGRYHRQHELAILCDIVSGWGVKKRAENPGAAKKQAFSRLIAQGYVEPAQEPSAIRYQHTAKTEVLFAQLCVGISGG